MKEKIVEVLQNIHEAKTAMEINDLLDFSRVEDYKEVQDTLNKLVEEYIVYYTKKEKYILLKNCPSLKIGRLSLNKKGFGFVIIPREDDVYISESNLNSATNDDIVLIEVTLKGINHEGRVVKIIKRELNNLVGEIYFKDNHCHLKLDNDRVGYSVEIDSNSAKDCVEGHKVLVKIVKELSKNKYLASVEKILGHKNDPKIDILSIAYKNGIYDFFNDAVLEEVESVPVSVLEADRVGRKDLTDQVIFTIDGDDTKDIDDALSFSMKGENYLLGVHIADVSHYVKEHTALGDEAYNRATSSYLADTVIPMLPHKLSNGICSLNPNVERLSMSCIMEINPKGKVVDYDIFPSIIKSRIQMTYKKVNDILVRGIVDEVYEPYKDQLIKMYELAKILRKEKEGRGYIDFDLDEAKIIQDENGKAIDVVKRVREVGEKLIEDFMIAANETVASHIHNMELPFIYRIHDKPNSEKINDFVNLVHQLGYKINHKITELTPSTMQKLLNDLNDKPEFSILSSLLLRSMQKAIYCKDNIGHFGLASRAYTHFTSPIRRYPDLMVHRLLKKYLVENDMSMSTIKFYENSLVEIAEHSSEMERAAVNAERDVLDMKKAEYMEEHIGEIHEGMITTVTNFGFFVELDNMVEGLVHVNNLKGDFYTYVPELLSMIGKSTKKRYRLGDKVTIKVINASKEAGFIDFEIANPPKNEGEKDGNQE